jgi:hypothetical protein
VSGRASRRPRGAPAVAPVATPARPLPILETGPDGWQSRAVDRLIDRLPALLLLGVILLAVQVAVFEVHQPVQIVGALPAALLLVLYLRAGSGGGGGKAKAKGGKD